MSDSRLDPLLRSVTRPARYSGGEWHSVVKPQARVRLALAFPDVYEVGMSNLGLSILYEAVNAHPDFAAERVYAPWQDMEAALRRARIPLFSLESKRPLGEFDVLGFSLGYELTYTNVLNMLDLSGLPVLARERCDHHPLVIAGGGCALNPEPMADFIDLFVLGEAEESLLELLALRAEGKQEGWSRQELLRQAAALPGIYVPSLYEVAYHADGALASISPLVAEAPATVSRRWLRELPPPPTHPVVPYLQVVHDRGAVELQRGCTRGCRFCQAGAIYRPLRRRPPEQIVEGVGELIRNCGYQEIALLALSASDYPGIEGVVAAIQDRYGEENIRISLPSLRLASFSVGLAESLRGQKKLGLTFAPEAGTYRLRQAINKTASEETILEALELARGWNSIKLYFMVGLPTEGDEDIVGIAELVSRISRLRGYGRRPTLRVSAAAFIPKAHTPFQWWPQDSVEAVERKYQLLRRALKPSGARLSWSDPHQALLEAVLARGDRRLGPAIHRAWRIGCTFDAWHEHFQYGRWLQALQDAGLDPTAYAQRPDILGLDEVLPWGHVDTGVRPAFLKREYHKALSGEDTPDCATSPCSACGLQRLSPVCRQRAKHDVAASAAAVPPSA